MRLIPSPEERPDLYDDYDPRTGPSTYPRDNWSKIRPEHVKERLARRINASRPDANTPTDID